MIYKTQSWYVRVSLLQKQHVRDGEVRVGAKEDQKGNQGQFEKRNAQEVKASLQRSS